MICEMEGVREDGEGFPVLLRRDSKSGRLLIRAFNECGNNYTDVDFGDLVDWLQSGPNGRLLETQVAPTPIGNDSSRDREGD